MNKLLQYILLTLLLCINPNTQAEMVSSRDQSDHTPFGMWLGHYTIKQLHQDYTAISVGTHEASEGQMYLVDIRSIKKTGLTKLTVIFDQQHLLQAILAEFDKVYYEQLYAELSEKYTLLTQTVSQQGDRKAQFIAKNDTTVTLEAAQNSFKANVFYKTNTFVRATALAPAGQ